MLSADVKNTPSGAAPRDIVGRKLLAFEEYSLIPKDGPPELPFTWFPKLVPPATPAVTDGLSKTSQALEPRAGPVPTLVSELLPPWPHISFPQVGPPMMPLTYFPHLLPPLSPSALASQMPPLPPLPPSASSPPATGVLTNYDVIFGTPVDPIAPRSIRGTPVNPVAPRWDHSIRGTPVDPSAPRWDHSIRGTPVDPGAPRWDHSIRGTPVDPGAPSSTESSTSSISDINTEELVLSTDSSPFGNNDEFEEIDLTFIGVLRLQGKIKMK